MRTALVRLGRALRARPALTSFLVLSAVGLAFGLDAPWTDDARFYLPAAESYARWVARAVGGPFVLDFSAWSRAAIDSAFVLNHEHPPVAKLAMGAGILALRAFGVGEVTGARVPVVLAWAASGALVVRLLWRRTSPWAALVGAAALALMPRYFFDGHVETLDVPVAALVTWTAVSFLEALESARPRDWLGPTVLAALALGTKLNAVFAVIALGVFWVYFAPPRREGPFVRLAPVPGALLGVTLVAPALALVTWPWLWADPLLRLAEYVRFHAGHYGILFYYGGVVYREHVAPWTAPWVMTALCLPLTTLALICGGALAPIARLLRPVASLLPGRSAASGAALASEPALAAGVLALLVVLSQLVAVSLPGVPVYGGVKLFAAAFPGLAALAGLGFHALEREAARVLRPPARGRVLAATAAVLLAPGLVGLVAYRGRWLSYYGELAGGLRGATASGYERQYYDLAYPELAAELSRALPTGGVVAVLPNPKEYEPYLARWRRLGLLPAGVRLGPPEAADVVVLTHERRWPEYPELAARWRAHRVLGGLEVAGVPLFTVYAAR